MPRSSILVLIFVVSQVNAEPLILPLNQFTSVGKSIINGVEGGAKLYLASIDDNSVLQQIHVQTGGRLYTLDTLNANNEDGTPRSIVLADNLYISTSNSDAVTANLTGFLYLTTKAQADDPNFSVYVIKDLHLISTKTMNATVVILNTWLPDYIDEDEPRRLSYVTGIQQAVTTNLFFQWGVPPSNWNTVNNNNTFFMNPVVLTNKTGTTNWFFDNIEPLQIGLDYWYFSTNGPINMKIEKKYVNNRNYTTTAVNSTGLIVNNFLYREHVVNFLRDDTRSGVSGLFASAFITSGTLGFYIQSGWDGISYELNQKTQIGWLYYAEDQGTQLVVNTTTSTPGTFYCQYFSHAGQLYPLTTPGSTVSPSSTQAVQTTSGIVSTTTVGTSTKGSAKGYGFQLVIGMMILMMID